MFGKKCHVSSDLTIERMTYVTVQPLLLNDYA